MLCSTAPSISIGRLCCVGIMQELKEAGAWVNTLGQVQTLRPITYAQRASLRDDMAFMAAVQ